MHTGMVCMVVLIIVRHMPVDGVNNGCTPACTSVWSYLVYIFFVFTLADMDATPDKPSTVLTTLPE